MKRILAVPATVLVLAAAPLLAQAASLPADAAPAADIWALPDAADFGDIIAGDSFSDVVAADPDPVAPTERRFLSFGGTSRLPEPAAWAMMMLGFGLAGAILRRRNRDRGLGEAIARPVAPAVEI